MTLSSIRRSPFMKPICVLVSLSFFTQFLVPAQLFALTSGPSQPEVQSFEPAGTTDMVDIFSGDFTYNIPLMELPGPNGGYPFNLSYHSGIGMDQEASWVGLGWNLNPGVINRSMRGIPDDFDGNEITKTTHLKDNYTYGISFGTTFELFGADNKVPPPSSSSGSLTLGLRLYYNNYKGVGYNFSPSFGYQAPGGGKMDGLGFNVGVSLDSQDGVGANASVDMKSPGGPEDNLTNSYSMGVGFNSKRGVDLSLSASTSNNFENSHKKKQTQSMGGGSSLSFAEQAFVPTVSMPMSSTALDVTAKLGAGIVGSYLSFSVGGFYNEQSLKKTTKNFKAYGYNNLEHAGDADMMDFNRTKDGTIRKESPNMPVPQLTYDIYSVMGQGIGGMYRPYRSDIGHVHDPRVISTSNGGTFGLDIGPTDHYGANFTYSSGTSTSGDWATSNGWSYYDFKDENASAYADYEPVYYKAHGEMTSFPTNELDYIGGEQPVRAELGEAGTSFTPKPGKLVNGYSPVANSTTSVRVKEQNESIRMPRNMSVQPITNEEMGGNSPVMKEYDIQLASGSVTRSGPDYDNLIGGITSINPEGMRYVYGLPAYNTEQEEYVYSVAAQGTSCGPTLDIPGNLVSGSAYKVSGTDEFFNMTEMPPYAYSYLLTSILGPDFVDLDNNGPDPGDMGYWVKFNYKKQFSDYEWKAPFKGANYMKGFESDAADNRAAFTRGKKEVYYLTSAESSTHIITFFTTARSDGGEAPGFNNSNNPAGDHFHKLDRMELKVRGSNELIQTVYFTYFTNPADQLCNGIHNGSGGKLTLKSVEFKYGSNDRGRLSPYEFDYGNINHTGPREANPGYNVNSYDRWGNYKDATVGDDCEKIEFPYVLQFDQGEDQTQTNKDAYKADMDKFAASWHLTDITLPTGGKIKIDYEADDYAYVQHKRPMQMFKIEEALNLGSQSSGDWKVVFKLEHPIDGLATVPEIESIIKKQYLDGMKVGGEYQLYYKAKMNLRDNYREFISGYATIDVSSGAYGVHGATEPVGSGGAMMYTKGFVTLKKMNINGSIDYHPFRVAAWQHMRTNQPDLLFNPGKLSDPPGSSDAAKANKIKSLMSVWPTIKTLFSGYRKYAYNKGYAGSMDYNKSYIRLTNPDGFKFGGGSRVKKIEITDEWSASTGGGESGSSYGQLYDYTMVENGDTISSGVASYEPMIGGDETPFRYAKNFPGHNPVMTDNNLFFEYPVNESYFPGPSVGYRMVTVRSLATDDVLTGAKVPEVATTGVVEHRFYTAKEFPVITDETESENRDINLNIPLPLIGQIQTNTLTCSQGYSIILNDMNGKQKSVKYYGMDKYGQRGEYPISTIEYYYKDKAKVMSDGSKVMQLDNMVDVLISDFDGVNAAETEQRLMGVEYEFFTDMRHSLSESSVGGLKANTDFAFSALFPIPIPVPWPTVIKTKTDLRVVVANKVIHKAAILEKTVATDGESTVITHNKLFDGLTGKPLLTSVQNNYDQPLNKMEYPAYWNYEGMSGAYKNFGVELSVLVGELLGNNQYAITNMEKLNGTSVSDQEAHRILQEGDELLIFHAAGTDLTTPVKATLIEHLDVGQGNYSFVIHTPGTYAQNDELRFQVVRSGRRNQISTIAGDVLAMGDPTSNIGIKNLPVVNLSNATEDFAQFMNEYALQCDGKLLVDQLIEFDHRDMFDNEGKYKYPETRKLLKQFKFNYCTSRQTGHYCEFCRNLPGDTDNNDEDSEGYHITDIIGRNESSGYCCCECVAYQRASGSATSTPILDFSVQSSTIINGHTVGRLKVDYNGRPSSDFCIFPRGSNPDMEGGGPDFNTCWNPVSYTPKVIYFDSVLNASAAEFTDYWDYEYPNLKCPVPAVEPNLYATGKKGIFRVSKNYYYKDERVQTLDNLKLSHDGMYENVDVSGEPLRFYPFRWNADLDWPLHERWIPNQTITQYNLGGFEVENRDILGNFSSALYGYGKILPVAVASNTDYFQVFFHSFDDPTASLAKVPSGTANTSMDYAHTGESSCVVTANSGNVNLKTSIRAQKGSTYYVSGWVKVANVDHYTFGGIPDISVAFYDEDWGNVQVESGNITLVGGVVEGWQKMEGEVTVPIAYDRGRVALVFGDDITNNVYYDDVRIVDTDGNIKTYVYHPDNYRLKAVLDENNYASIYSYDEEGKLYLVQKETENGIMTIQESRNHIKE